MTFEVETLNQYIIVFAQNGAFFRFFLELIKSFTVHLAPECDTHLIKLNHDLKYNYSITKQIPMASVPSDRSPLIYLQSLFFWWIFFGF